ncbi:hypothetical protein NKH77_28590 [Streptomyces sp. M19]
MSEPTDVDAWRNAVHYFTGYNAPKFADIFTEWKGNNDIPLMKVELTKQSSVTYVDVDDLNWRLDNAGYGVHNTDFVIPFYTTKDIDESGRTRPATRSPTTRPASRSWAITTGRRRRRAVGTWVARKSLLRQRLQQVGQRHDLGRDKAVPVCFRYGIRPEQGAQQSQRWHP